MGQVLHGSAATTEAVRRALGSSWCGRLGGFDPLTQTSYYAGFAERIRHRILRNNASSSRASRQICQINDRFHHSTIRGLVQTRLN